MTLGRPNLLLCLLLFLSLWHRQAASQPSGARTLLTVEEIAAALTDAGLSATPGQVRLPAPVFTSAMAPKLRVEKQEQIGPQQQRLRLACADASLCLPFYATLTGVTQVAPPNNTSAAGGPTLSPTQQTRSEPKVLHAGDHAVLMLEDRYMRISVPVILIDTGHRGDGVRVASLDRKQVYQGKVWEDGTIHGSLP